jgi:hypothetical protein
MSMNSTVWIIATLLLVSLGIAVGCLVRNLVRDNRNSLVAELPLRQEQTINVPPGPVVLLLEGPRFSNDLRSFKIHVRDGRTGQTTSFSQGYFKPRVKVSGMSTAKIPYGRLEGNSPGELVIRVDGFQPNEDYSGYRVVLSRPFGVRLALQITGIVLCGVGMLLCILWVCLGTLQARPGRGKVSPADTIGSQKSGSTQK